MLILFTLDKHILLKGKPSKVGQEIVKKIKHQREQANDKREKKFAML